MSAPRLETDGSRLMCDGVAIGEVKRIAGYQHLVTPGGQWAFDGIEAFRALTLAYPSQAMREVGVAFDDARQFAEFASSSIRRKDHEEATRDMARVDEALGVAKAWRRLAGYEVTP